MIVGRVVAEIFDIEFGEDPRRAVRVREERLQDADP
jgi:hypothetical protein